MPNKELVRTQTTLHETGFAAGIVMVIAGGWLSFSMLAGGVRGSGSENRARWNGDKYNYVVRSMNINTSGEDKHVTATVDAYNNEEMGSV